MDCTVVVKLRLSVDRAIYIHISFMYRVCSMFEIQSNKLTWLSCDHIRLSMTYEYNYCIQHKLHLLITTSITPTNTEQRIRVQKHHTENMNDFQLDCHLSLLFRYFMLSSKKKQFSNSYSSLINSIFHNQGKRDQMIWHYQKSG